jgi:hypothetical protein
MTDTDVTFPPIYNNMDLARLYVMILDSPPSLPLSRRWAGLGVLWPSLALLNHTRDSRVASPRIITFLLSSLSIPGYKKMTNDITLLPDYNRCNQFEIGSCLLTRLDPYRPFSPFSPLTLDKVGSRVYLPPRTPRLRVCQSQNPSHQSPPVGSSNNAYPQDAISLLAPKCQCQSPRQNATVNLLAKLPMSIPSPKCTTDEPLTPSPSRCPRAGLTQKCPTLGILRPLYLLDFDSHSALPISARNTSIKPYLTRSATHRPNLS